MRLNNKILLLIPAVFIVVVGCGPNRPEMAPVHGTVTLNGAAVAGAQVMLVPRQGGRPAQGITDEQGNFVIKTFEDGDGALLGHHDITVTSKRLISVGGAKQSGSELDALPQAVHYKWLTPKRYSRKDTSGLSVEVKPDMEPLALELVSP